MKKILLLLSMATAAYAGTEPEPVEHHRPSVKKDFMNLNQMLRHSRFDNGEDILEWDHLPQDQKDQVIEALGQTNLYLSIRSSEENTTVPLSQHSLQDPSVPLIEIGRLHTGQVSLIIDTQNFDFLAQKNFLKKILRGDIYLKTLNVCARDNLRLLLEHCSHLSCLTFVHIQPSFSLISLLSAVPSLEDLSLCFDIDNPHFTTPLESLEEECKADWKDKRSILPNLKKILFGDHNRNMALPEGFLAPLLHEGISISCNATPFFIESILEPLKTLPYKTLQMNIHNRDQWNFYRARMKDVRTNLSIYCSPDFHEILLNPRLFLGLKADGYLFETVSLYHSSYGEAIQPIPNFRHLATTYVQDYMQEMRNCPPALWVPLSISDMWDAWRQFVPASLNKIITEYRRAKKALPYALGTLKEELRPTGWRPEIKIEIAGFHKLLKPFQPE